MQSSWSSSSPPPPPPSQLLCVERSWWVVQCSIPKDANFDEICRRGRKKKNLLQDLTSYITKPDRRNIAFFFSFFFGLLGSFVCLEEDCSRVRSVLGAFLVVVVVVVVVCFFPFCCLVVGSENARFLSFSFKSFIICELCVALFFNCRRIEIVGVLYRMGIYMEIDLMDAKVLY